MIHVYHLYHHKPWRESESEHIVKPNDCAREIIASWKRSNEEVEKKLQSLDFRFDNSYKKSTGF